MGINRGSFIRSTFLLLPVILIMSTSLANGQTNSNSPGQEAIATMTSPSTSKAATTNVPLFKDYRGVTIGMAADDVRAKLERLKTGDGQDFLTYSDRESAQIYYDAKGKVTAISIDYFGGDSNAPTPEAVLGVGIQPKPNGSMYQLNRYPEAGYWVSYNRTAGEKPIITITMQKM